MSLNKSNEIETIKYDIDEVIDKVDTIDEGAILEGAMLVTEVINEI